MLFRSVILWAMEIAPAKDEHGEDIPVDVDGYLDSGSGMVQ